MTLQQSITLPPPTAKIKSIFSFFTSSTPSCTFLYVGLDIIPLNSITSLFSSFNKETIT